MAVAALVWILVMLVCSISAKQLVMIQETFRHGARFPVFPEKEDQSNTPYIMQNLGQLTSQGKNMHYLLGKIIYEKYWDELFKGTPYQNSYSQTQLYVKSTDKNRTIQSAQSHLFGLLQKLPILQLSNQDYQYSLPMWKNFQQSTNVSQIFEIFETGPAFHPTPVHVEKRGATPCDSGDFLTKYDDESCPNQKFWRSQNFNTDQHNKVIRDPRVKEAISALSKQIGREVQFEDVYKWTDTYSCMKYLGFPTLKVFENAQYKKTLDFIQVYTTYLGLYAQKDQISAVATDYFKRTLHLFQSKANETFTPRIVIYSSHDTTIGLIFASMKLTTVQCIIDHYLNQVNNDQTCIWQYPPFTANVIFQLWNNNGQYTIRMLYNGEVKKIPICGMKIQCTLDQFREWVNDLVVDDVSSACGYVGNQKVYYAVIFLMGSALVLFVAYVIFLHAKIKKIDSIGRAKKQGYQVNFQEKLDDRNQEMDTKNDR